MTSHAAIDFIDVDNTRLKTIKVIMGRDSNEQIWVLNIGSSPKSERSVTISSQKGLRIHTGKAVIIGPQSQDDFYAGQRVAAAERGQIRVGRRFVYQREGSMLKELSPNVVTAFR
jgi:hypothetical protein